MKTGLKNILKIIIPLLVVGITLLFVAGAVKSGSGSPDNPLNGEKPAFSKMYETISENTMMVKTETLEKIKEEQKKQQEKEEQKLKDKKDDKKDHKKDDSKDDQKKLGNDDSDDKPGNDDNPDNPSDNPSDNPGDDSGDDPEPLPPGEDEEDDWSDFDEDTVYFLTTIRDNETVSYYEYEFEIIHIQESLTVEKEQVFVNGQESENFAGSVMLADGENTIKVKVSYLTESNKRITAEKAYTVFVDCENLYITTDLEDQTVDSPYFDFEAYAKKGSKDAELTVVFNGEEITGSDGSYSVTLESGENTIDLYAKYGSYTAEESYEIVFEAGEDFDIFTTLEDETVNEDSYSFDARIVNGSNKAKLTVTVNGEKISGSGGSYTTPLEIGNNTIRLKGSDVGGKTKTQTYTITYVPLATPDTEPVLKSINISDGMEIDGESFNLKIKAEDYEGNKIYYSGITVRLNGKKIQYRWSNEFVTYTLNLLSGENTVEVRLTDGAGRYVDFEYTVICTYIAEGTPIGSVSVSVDAKVLNLGTLMSASDITLGYGDNAAVIVKNALEDAGFDVSSTGTTRDGFYLEALGMGGITSGFSIDQGLHDEIEEDGLMFNIDPDTDEYIYDPDSLGQFDFCQGSGWMYEVNGEFMSYGLSDYVPKDGDHISIRFTLSYGKDLGAYSQTGGSYGIKDHYEHTY